MNRFLQGHANLRFLTKTNNSIIDFNHYMFRLVGVTNRFSTLILDLITPIIYLSIVVFSFIYFLLRLILGCLLYYYAPKVCPKNIDTIHLFFFNFYADRCKAAKLYESSLYYIIMPGIDHKFVNLKDKIVLNYKNYLKKRDAFIIFAKSMHCLLEYVTHEYSLCLVHKSWEYYELQVALTRLSKNATLCFCNQSDKWAILFDNIPSKSKVLIQHGIASNWGCTPYPLKNIDVFYSMTKGTWQDAYMSILKCNPELKMMEPTISLFETQRSSFRVLIVADIIQLDNERKVLKELSEIDGLTVFLKKHPALQNDECYRDLQLVYKFEYITEKKFPRVDFVISYYSTLAYEYMAYDIPVYMYMTKEEYSSEDMLKHLHVEMDKWRSDKILQTL